MGRLLAAATTHMAIPGVVLNSQGTAALAANLVRYFPIYVVTPIVVDQLVLEVTTLAGSTTARMGIYHADKDWVPGALVVDGGTVATDSTGVKAASVTAPLAPGRYLMATNSNGTATIRTFRGFLANQWLMSTLGASSVVFLLRGAQTYGAFPATGTAIDTVSASTIALDYYMCLRISTP